MYEDVAPVAKVHLLQSLVSGTLVDMVFDAYFAGLSQEQTVQLKQAEELLRSLCKFMLHPLLLPASSPGS